MQKINVRMSNRRKAPKVSTKKARSLIRGAEKAERTIEKLRKQTHSAIDKDANKKVRNAHRLRRVYTTALAQATKREKKCKKCGKMGCKKRHKK